MNLLRRRSRGPRPMGDAVLNLLDDAWDAADRRTPSDQLELLRDCMEKLTDRARYILQLRYTEGIKGEALAEVRAAAEHRLRGPVASINSWANASSRALQTKLEGRMRRERALRSTRPLTMRDNSSPSRCAISTASPAERRKKHWSSSFESNPVRRRWFVTLCHQLGMLYEVCSADEEHYPQSSAPLIIPDLSPATGESWSANLFSPGSQLFSYVTAAVVFWESACWSAGHGKFRTITSQPSSRAPRSQVSELTGAESPLVGRITGMVDCPLGRSRRGEPFCTALSRARGSQLQASLRVHGDHLRHGGQGHPPGSGHV